MSSRTLIYFFDREGNPIPENKRTIEILSKSTEKQSVDYLIEIYFLSECESLFWVQGGDL